MNSNKLIISSQRSASTYSMLLHQNAFYTLSEPYDPKGKNYGKHITKKSSKPWCVKTHARDIMDKSIDELYNEYKEIWILQRKNRTNQILSFALALNRNFWSTSSVAERDFYRYKVVRLSKNEIDFAKDLINFQSEFLSSFPTNKKIYTEDLKDNVVLDSLLWQIPKEKIVSQKPKLKLWNSSDAILNLEECLQWIN